MRPVVFSSAHAGPNGGDSAAAAAGSGSGGIFSTPLSLSDLTLGDREKALRLLYAKIMHVPSGLTLALPPHSFDISLAPGEQATLLQNQGRPPLLSLPPTPPLRTPGLAAGAASTSATAAAAALPSSPPVPQLMAGGDTAPAAAAASSPAVDAPASSYDDTFLTNFRADDADDDDDGGGGDEWDARDEGVEDVD